MGRCREIAGVFATVERMLREDNLGTFGHMITTLTICCSRTANWPSRASARFILVDEFQDVNFAQVKVLQKLAGEERNVFAVGDPGPGHLSLPRSLERGLRAFSAPLSGREAGQAGEKPPLTVAHSALRLRPDRQKSERVRRRTVPPAYQRSVLISAREEDAAQAGNQLPRVHRWRRSCSIPRTPSRAR